MACPPRICEVYVGEREALPFEPTSVQAAHLPEAHAPGVPLAFWLKEEDHFLVQEFPDAVEERVAQAVIPTAHLGMDVGSGNEQFARHAFVWRNVVALDADGGEHDRLGFVGVVRLLWLGLPA